MKRRVAGALLGGVGLLAAAPAGADEPVRAEVTGGVVAGPELGAVAALVDGRSEDAEAGLLCSGTLIASGWVLTAAHCVEELLLPLPDLTVVVGDLPIEAELLEPLAIEDLVVVVGAGDLRAGEGAGERRGVAEVVVHEDWVNGLAPIDLALLRLDAPVRTAPLGLADEDAEPSGAVPSAAVVAGWGLDAEAGDAGRLRAAVVPVHPSELCERVGVDPEIELCAGGTFDGEVTAAAPGDSGGPLLVAGPGGRALVAGITSGGVGVPGRSPATFVRVAPVLGWIDEVVGGRSDETGVAASVRRLYLAAFEREPDPLGLAHWTGQVLAGAPLTAVADAFVRSPEFLARYGSLDDGEFVRLVYVHVLGREPDADGAGHWTEALAGRAMTRGALLVGFSESDEFRVLTADAD